MENQGVVITHMILNCAHLAGYMTSFAFLSKKSTALNARSRTGVGNIPVYGAGQVAKFKPVEVLFWSIAFPGFGQFLNGKFLKGITLLALELIINLNANLNTAIVSSFQGDILTAIEQTNYQWLMFYPCVYLFGMWDAYRDAGGGQELFSFFPFVFSAFFGTVGVAYSINFNLFGILFGPIWLPILFLFIGVGVGLAIKQFLLNRMRAM